MSFDISNLWLSTFQLRQSPKKTRKKTEINGSVDFFSARKHEEKKRSKINGSVFVGKRALCGRRMRSTGFLGSLSSKYFNVAFRRPTYLNVLPYFIPALGLRGQEFTVPRMSLSESERKTVVCSVTASALSHFHHISGGKKEPDGRF